MCQGPPLGLLLLPQPRPTLPLTAGHRCQGWKGLIHFAGEYTVRAAREVPGSV